MPNFARICWVSELARNTWSPRFLRIIRAWSDVEWLSVRNGVRKCAMISPAPMQAPIGGPRWNNEGLAHLALGRTSSSGNGLSFSRTFQSEEVRFIALGEPQHLRTLEEAWKAQDHSEIGAHLGYPQCCTCAFTKRCVDGNATDPTWAIASCSVSPTASIDIDADRPGRSIANIFWRGVGIRAIPHLPCKIDCSPSIHLASGFLNTGMRFAFGEEMDWLEEILQWPLEWSALHGIAEIKTPILKISARTDPTSEKITLRWHGSAYPEEGARGRRFPYGYHKHRLTQLPA